MLYKLCHFQCIFKIMMILNQCTFELISFEFSFGDQERHMSSECRATIKKFGEKHCQNLQKLLLLGIFCQSPDEEDFPYTSFLRLDSSDNNGTVKSFTIILMTL